MFETTSDGALETLLAKLDQQLGISKEIDLGIPTDDEVIMMIKNSDLLAMGRALVALSNRPREDPLIEHLCQRVLCQEWLEALCSGQHEKQVIAFAQHRILDRLTGLEKPTPFRLSVQHIQGQLKTVKDMPPNGLEKLLAAIESLNDSKEFLSSLTEVDESMLCLYNTSAEQVRSTLEEVEEQIMIYRNFIEAEMFSDHEFAKKLAAQDQHLRVDPPTKLEKEPDQESKPVERTEHTAKTVADLQKRAIRKEAEPLEKPTEQQAAQREARAQLVSLSQQQNDARTEALSEDLMLLLELSENSPAREEVLIMLQSLVSRHARGGCEFQADPIVLKALKSQAYAKLVRMKESRVPVVVPSLAALARHSRSIADLKNKFAQTPDLEIAFAIYLNSSTDAELANYQEWLQLAISSLVLPYRNVGADPDLVGKAFGSLYYLLLVTKHFRVCSIWPFDGWSSTIQSFL